MTTEAMTKAFFKKKIGESEKTNRTIIKNGMLNVSSELFSASTKRKKIFVVQASCEHVSLPMFTILFKSCYVFWYKMIHGSNNKKSKILRL